MKMSLYKYMPLVGKKAFERLESYLNQEVWLTPLNQFNDPFEGKFRYKHLNPEAILSNPELLSFFFLKHLEDEPNLKLEEFKNRLKSSDFQEALQSNESTLATNIFQSHGALCLTSDFRNIPMWAYYGNEHKGCCLEFEVDFSLIQNSTGISHESIEWFKQDFHARKTILSFSLNDSPYHFIFLRVNYEKTMPIIDLNELMKITNEFSRLEYITRRSVGVKFAQWEHEDEFRLIVNANSKDYGLLPLSRFAPFLKITSIIVGSAMTLDSRQKLRELSKKYNIKLMDAFCSEFDYQIQIKEQEDLCQLKQQELISLVN
jgi:hypothetical protein